MKTFVFMIIKMNWCFCLKFFKLIKKRAVYFLFRIPEKPCENSQNIDHDMSRENVIVDVSIEEISYRRRSKIINVLGNSITLGSNKKKEQRIGTPKIKRFSIS